MGTSAAEATARRVLDVLLASRFRKGPLDERSRRLLVAANVDGVARRVAVGRPVQLTLIGFPFKVPNPHKVGARRLPDLAEVAALRKLRDLHRAVQRVYEPGVSLVVLHDGTYIAPALDVDRKEALDYAERFAWLVRVTGASFISTEDLEDVLAFRRRRSPARSTAAPGIEDRVALRKTFGMLNVREERPATVKAVEAAISSGDTSGLDRDAADLHRRAERAACGYAALDDALHQDDPRPLAFPDAVHLTTRARPDRLVVWTVARGKSRLPWHGVGVRDRTGRVDVGQAGALDPATHRPVHLPGDATPFFYETVPS